MRNRDKIELANGWIIEGIVDDDGDLKLIVEHTRGEVVCIGDEDVLSSDTNWADRFIVHRTETKE